MSVGQWEKSRAYDYEIIFHPHSRLRAYKFYTSFGNLPKYFLFWHNRGVLRLLVPYKGLSVFRKSDKLCWKREMILEYTAVQNVFQKKNAFLKKSSAQKCLTILFT